MLDLSHLVHDQHFSTNAKRVTNRNVLAQMLAPAIAGMPRDELLDRFTQAGVPGGAVNSIDQALGSAVAQKLVLEEMMDGVRTLRISGNAFRIEDY